MDSVPHPGLGRPQGVEQVVLGFKAQLEAGAADVKRYFARMCKAGKAGVRDGCVVERYGAGCFKPGLPYWALDMPGTGDAPIKIDVGFERVFSRAIALQTRPTGPQRIGLQGGPHGHCRAQAPMEDLYMVLRTGTTAKEAWAHPSGGHIGRNRELSEAQIFEGVIATWFARMFKQADLARLVLRCGGREVVNKIKSHRPPTAALGQPPACVRLPSVRTERLL
jgi:hypothetical protein